jgi:hypothetical protein
LKANEEKRRIQILNSVVRIWIRTKMPRIHNTGHGARLGTVLGPEPPITRPYLKNDNNMLPVFCLFGIRTYLQKV